MNFQLLRFTERIGKPVKIRYGPATVNSLESIVTTATSELVTNCRAVSQETCLKGLRETFAEGFNGDDRLYFLPISRD